MTTPLSHVPAFHTYVDFTTDTSFAYANATEISSDVETFDIVGRGKNLLKQQAEAACMTLVLKNATHKYTPSYTGSAIYPNLLPGKHIWSLMGYPADLWVGMANNDTLASRKPDHDATFAAWAGDTTHWKYVSADLGVEPSNGLSTLPAVLDFGESCCHVGALIKAPSDWGTANETPSIIFRYSDASNYWRAGIAGGSAIYVQKVVAGVVVSTTGEAYTWPAGETHWLIVELTATGVFRVFVDNVGIVNSPTVDVFNSTATKHGIGIGPSTASVGGTIIEFGGYRPVFTGRVDTWSPDFDQTKNQCTMVAYDDMERQYIYPVMKTAPAAPTYAGDIINEILDGLDYSAYHRAVDDGAVLLAASAAGQERLLTRDALTEIHQVEGDDAGFFWIDGNGLAHYESYAFRSSMPVVRTWYASRQLNTEADICFHYQGSVYDDGKDRVLNDILYNYYFMGAPVTSTPVWNLNNAYDKPYIGPGQTITLCARGSADQIANPITPVGTTDFTVNTQADGGGTDITVDCVGAIVTGALAFSGNSAIITLKNKNASGGYVTFFQLRADKQSNSTLVTGARGSDATSQEAYGLRRFTWDTLHIADFTTAQLQVLKLLSIRKPRLAHWTFTMTNATQANLMQIIHRTISERVTVVHTPITLNSDFNIENWSIHIPQDGGAYIECKWEIQSTLPLLYGWLHKKMFTPAELVEARGTITATHNSTAIVGAGALPPLFTYWNVGDRIKLPDSKWYTIAAIADNIHLTLSSAYTGTTTSGASYTMERVNYPMLLTVHRTTGSDSGTDVYVGTECKADYSDLRFCLTDMSTLLPYWIEHNTITSSSAKVWVNIPSILSDSSAQYYMLFGNSLAVDASDGANTFTDFEDFDALDVSKWAESGTYQMASSVITLWTGAKLGALAAYKYGAGFAFRFNINAENEWHGDRWQWWYGGAFSSSELLVTTGSGVNLYRGYGYPTQKWYFQATKDNVTTSNNRAALSNAMHTVELRRYSGSCEYWLEDVYQDSISTNIPTASCGFEFTTGDWPSEAYLWLDFAIVRKVACTEPTFGTWGAEE